jgi:hypothetical protein
MSREIHVRFCESREVRSLPATHLVGMCYTKDQAERLRRRLSGWLALRGLHSRPTRSSSLRGRSPASTSAMPTSACFAAASTAAVVVGYSARYSSTRRTARFLRAGSIFFGMLFILPD